MRGDEAGADGGVARARARPGDGVAARHARRRVARATRSPSRDDAVWVARDGHQLEARTSGAARGGAGALAGSLEAPMPGTVLLVHVADGDAWRRATSCSCSSR